MRNLKVGLQESAREGESDSILFILADEKEEEAFDFFRIQVFACSDCIEAGLRLMLEKNGIDKIEIRRVIGMALQKAADPNKLPYFDFNPEEFFSLKAEEEIRLAEEEKKKGTVH